MVIITVARQQLESLGFGADWVRWGQAAAHNLQVKILLYIIYNLRYTEM